MFTILRRAWAEFRDDNIPLIAAGVTFYTLLALFPGIGAFVALYGLFADVSEAREQIQALAGVLPAQIVEFVGAEMVRVAGARAPGLSFAFASGLVLSIWSAGGAAKALMLGLNISFEEKEKRGFLRRTLVALAFTLVALLAPALGLSAAVFVPWLLKPLGEQVEVLVNLGGWAALLAALVIGITAAYRWGPSGHPVRWRNALLAACGVAPLWAAMSMGFSVYVGHFAHYDRTYGPLGAVIGVMFWTYLSVVILLAGSELAAELQARSDPRPKPDIKLEQSPKAP